MTFKYFAYGSNLSSYRLSISCKSIRKICCAKLNGYNLTFARFSKQWQGGSASVQKSTNSNDIIWGVIWEIDDKELQALDNQEGVKSGVYKPVDVEVETAKGEVHECRTYEMLDIGGRHEYCDPSPQYFKTIFDGAIRNGIPNEYIDKLSNIQTNGNTVITDHIRKIEKLREECE